MPEIKQAHMRQERLIQYLGELITENKREKIDRALTMRSRYLTAVLEEQIHPHNSSAVLRTMDCLGLQEFYLMEGEGKKKVSLNVAKGAGKWMDVFRYRAREGKTIAHCIHDLRARGFKIAVTSPHIAGFTPENMPLNQPVAVVFGNEKLGVSEEALSLADMHLQVPMFGFTESYNLSVCAALCFYTLAARMRTEGQAWALSEPDKKKLQLQWYRQLVHRSDLHEKKLMEGLSE